MSNYPVGQRPRSADPQSKLRLAALTAVVAGVVLLAAAAFVLSYSGIHQVALQAGVSPSLAKLYPVIFDAMLVVAGAAAMALRGAGWWSRFYAWACLILLLVAVAVGDAVHATGTVLPERASRAAVAITPWVLLLLAFGLLLTMLRHFRKARAAVAARQEARAAAAADAGTAGRAAADAGTAGRAAADAGTAGRAAEANGTAAGRSAVTWAAASAASTAVGTAAGAEGRALPPPLSGLDLLLGPRAGQAPAIEAPHVAGATDTGTGDDAGHGDPVSYGEETGYVHPDSYRDEGEYSPHGDSGGPVMYTAPGDPAQAEPASNGDAAPQQDTAADTSEGDGPADTGAPESHADAAAVADGGPVGERASGDGDGDGEPAAAQSPSLERMRSSPTRPEE